MRKAEQSNEIMEDVKPRRRNTRTTTAQSGANPSTFAAQIPQNMFLGSLKKWLGGMVNNPNTGALSHDKVWANVAAAVLTYQFLKAPQPPEWHGGLMAAWWAVMGWRDV